MADVCRSSQHRQITRNADGVYAGEPAGRDRFDIAFDAGDLAGEEQTRICAGREVFVQYLWRIDKCIPVYLAKLQKLGVLQARNQLQNPLLLAVTQMILKSDQPIGVGHHIFLPQLNTCPRFAPRLWIGQAARLHRAVSQSIDAAAGGFFDWQTALEPMRVLKTL